MSGFWGYIHSPKGVHSEYSHNMEKCSKINLTHPTGVGKPVQYGKESGMIPPRLFSQEVFILSSKVVSFWDATLIIIKKHFNMFLFEYSVFPYA